MSAAWIWSALGLRMPMEASVERARASADSTSSGLIAAGGVKPARLRVLSDPLVVSITVVPFCRPFTSESALVLPPAQLEYFDEMRAASPLPTAAKAGSAARARAAAAMRIMAGLRVRLLAL